MNIPNPSTGRTPRLNCWPSSARRRQPNWRRNYCARYLDGLAALVVPVTPYFLWRPTLRDPDDEMVLDAAVNERAEAIVTFNVRDFLPGATRFRVAVLTPAQTLRRL